MNNKTSVNIQNKIEEEKKLLGGTIYSKRFFMPHIYITPDNYDEFIDDIDILDKIGNQFGLDITDLFAELYLIYEMDVDPNFEKIINATIREFSVTSSAKINLALIQIKELKKLLSSSKKTEIIGDQYCFIVIMLQELLMIYTSFIIFIYVKRYLDDKSMEAIKERIDFIASYHYESLRKKFNVIHCFSISENEKLQTIH
jgi:hypothetical protein